MESEIHNFINVFLLREEAVCYDFIPMEEALWSATLFLKMRRRDWQFYAPLRGATLRWMLC